MSRFLFDAMDVGAASEAIRIASKRFYVYVLVRPDGEPFYVGKGLGKRLFNHEAEARNTNLRTHKLNVIRSIVRSGGEVGYALPHFCENEAEAHGIETKLISSIGRHDLKKGPLTNQTDGGEGVTGLSTEILARKAANLGGASEDPQRRVANDFFHAIAGRQDSVPIKPLGVTRLEATVPHPRPRKPTERMAKAIVVACLATNQLLAEGVRLPRLFKIKGGTYVIENGVAKDLLKAGMISVIPGERPELEQFTLTQVGLAAILSLIPRPRLEDLGALEPAIYTSVVADSILPALTR
jgi:hypothetical protein